MFILRHPASAQQARGGYPPPQPAPNAPSDAKALRVYEILHEGIRIQQRIAEHETALDRTIPSVAAATMWFQEVSRQLDAEEPTYTRRLATLGPFGKLLG